MDSSDLGLLAPSYQGVIGTNVPCTPGFRGDKVPSHQVTMQPTNRDTYAAWSPGKLGTKASRYQVTFCAMDSRRVRNLEAKLAMKR